MRTRLLSLIALPLILGALAPPLDAQIRGSERALVTQTVDGTTISVDYGRPQVRGRGEVFGNLVDWDHIWTPGANWATTFEFSKDVELNGTPVPEGKYSVWMIANPDEFEVVLDPNPEIFHTMRPPRTESQISVMAPAMSGPYAEVLTFSFPRVRSTGTDLMFQWGETMVPIFVKVQPTQTFTMPADVAAQYVGRYEAKWVAPIPLEAVPEAERPKAVSTIELGYTDQELKGTWDLFEKWETSGIMMVPKSEHIFSPGFMRDGALFETDNGLFIEFVVEDGKAVRMEIYDGIAEDLLVWRAERIN
jgi:Protein of unknown function (DUF2911)